jgi:hypothetical protein
MICHQTASQLRAQEFAIKCVPAFKGLCLQDIQVKLEDGDCEWGGRVFFLTGPDGTKAVVRHTGDGFAASEQDLQPFLNHRRLCEETFSRSGLGPKLLGVHGNRWFCSEYMAGGNISASDFAREDFMAEFGNVFAKMHKLPIPKEFYNDVNSTRDTSADSLFTEKIPAAHLHEEFSNNFATWQGSLRTLRLLYDTTNDDAWQHMATHGISKQHVLDMIEDFASDDFFNGDQYKDHPLWKRVVCHNDLHSMNLMWDASNEATRTLKIIDYDFLFYGHAGADLCLAWMMSFGFVPFPAELASMNDNPEILDYCAKSSMPVKMQRVFVKAYLTEMKSTADKPVDISDDEVEEVLFQLHRWMYFAIVRLGIIAMTLCKQDWCKARPAKRPYMQALAPLLLSKNFLAAARDILIRAENDPAVREQLLQRGVANLAQEQFNST